MSSPRPKITLLSSANWSVLVPRIAKSLSGHLGFEVELSVPAFGQYRMMLADPGSELRRARADYHVFAERCEDFILPFETLDGRLAATIAERFQDYLQTIRVARAELEGVFLIHDLVAVRPYLATLRELSGQDSGITNVLQAMNRELAALADELRDTVVVPVSFAVGEIGRRSADPGKYWLIGRVPFSSKFSEPYAKLLGGLLLARQGKTVRALALDLDNTLWGGVVGDDGIAGLQCGTDFPDNRFLMIQEFARALKRRGIVLTVLSKNTEAVALEAIEKHPGMTLRKNELVGWSISWDPKPEGLRQIADELGLGEGSFLFLDDNPVERDEMRRSVPAVHVPELPADVSEWPAALFAEPCLAAIGLTKEDLGRARSYEIRRQINEQSGSKSREEFLSSLEMTLCVAPQTNTTARRIAQLFAKTNQFNTTARRFGEGDLRALEERGGDVLGVQLTDRYGSDEIIGALAISYDTDASVSAVEGFVMSCRVLGRGVETGILSAVAERALARGMRELRGTVVPSDRNQPCRMVFAEHGFRAAGDGTFILDLASDRILWPRWFQKIPASKEHPGL